MKHLAKLKELVGQTVAVCNEGHEQSEGPVQYWMIGKLEAQEEEDEADSPFYVRVADSAHGFIGISFKPSRVIDVSKGVYIYTIVLK